ncbi:MAG: hypothetical protein WD404_10520 [Solirubrobacterales bacterium]
MQFDLAGTLAVPDGRYLAREGDGGQRVLVVATRSAAPSPSRRRHRPKQAEPGEGAPPLPLARVTAVRAQEPFESAAEAGRWLEQAVSGEDSIEAAVAEALDLLNRALHAQAAATADPHGGELDAERAATVRIGYGSGEEVAASRFSEAHRVDVRGGGSRRQRREEELRPQERLAAVLGGREQIDACETLLLRARADLDAGRTREAALQLRVALEALLIELSGALADPDHERDMTTLEQRRGEAGEAANAALRGELDNERERQVGELLALCERVLRRRRILRG